MRNRYGMAAVGIVVAVAMLIAWQTVASAPFGATVTGVVLDAHGPVPGAVVRQQTRPDSTTAGPDGAFILSGVDEGITVTITAWDEGYWPGGVEVVAPADGVTITLTPHPTGDNPDHDWYTSMPDPEHAIGCGHCMVAFPQWVTNAHGTSAVNPRFFSLYNGTDLAGTIEVTPGYQLDFPGSAGNCATCHAPGAAADHPFTTDMNELEGVELEGVFCDYCHKVSGAYLDPATSMPYPNMPGVQSLQLSRPPSDTHMFYGPFDDVTRRVSYLQLEKESAFCAACHQFSFWGTPIYESYAEWLASPYPDQGIECQTCHMAPTGVDYFVYPHQGGLIRPPELIASHLQPGASDVALLQETVTLTLVTEQRVARLDVTAAITNYGAGHHVPTDFPGRQLLLVVTATGALGEPLLQQAGPSVPDWGGPEAGLPGAAFAKLLRDNATGEWPVVSYWKPSQIVTDTRIPAMACDRSTYAFTVPPSGGPVTVTATLSLRRVFAAEAEARGWDKSDIVMEQATVVVPAHAWRRTLLPLLVRRSP